MSEVITYTDSGGIKTIPCTEILRFRSSGNYSQIVFCDGRKEITLTIQIGKLNEHLTQSHPFFRIHNCHYVNMDYAQKITNDRKALLFMKKGLPIPIGKTYLAPTRQRLRNHNR